MHNKLIIRKSKNHLNNSLDSNLSINKFDNKNKSNINIKQYPKFISNISKENNNDEIDKKIKNINKNNIKKRNFLISSNSDFLNDNNIIGQINKFISLNEKEDQEYKEAFFNHKDNNFDNLSEIIEEKDSAKESIFEEEKELIEHFKDEDKEKEIIPKIEINKNKTKIKKRELIPKVIEYSDIYSNKYHPQYLFSYESDYYYCSSYAWNKHFFMLDFSQEYYFTGFEILFSQTYYNCKPKTYKVQTFDNKKRITNEFTFINEKKIN